jgi:hypothetical protein
MKRSGNICALPERGTRKRSAGFAQTVKVTNTQVAPAPVLMFLPNDMPLLETDKQAAAHSNECIAG